MQVLRIWVPAAGITAAEQELDWAGLDARGQLLQQGRAPLAQLPASARTELIIAPERVLLTQVSLPRQNRRQLQRVVAFALEDRLLGSPEQSHCALAAHAVDGQWPVAVVDRAWLGEVLQQVQALRPVQAAWPAWYWLPVGGTLWQGTEGWCRTQAHQGDYVIERRAGLDELAVDFDLTTLDWQRRAPDAAAINLLQGPLAARERAAGQRSPWLVTAGLAAAVVLVLWGQLAWQVWQGRQEARALDLQLRQGFYKVFPESASLVDPLLQVERRVQEQMAGPAAAPADDFLVMLNRAAPQLRAAGPIKAMEYRDGELRVDLQLPASAVSATTSQVQSSGLQVQGEPPAAPDQPLRLRLNVRKENP